MAGVLQGKSIVYSITVENAGPNAASNVSLSDAVPTGTTLAGITYPSDMMTSLAPVGQTATVKCGITSLASGASTSLQLTVKVAATAKGSVQNTAKVLEPGRSIQSAATTPRP